MPNCELSIGFDLDCKDGVGGVKRIVLAEWSIDFPQDITLNGSEVITALPAVDLWTYELPTQTASFEETINFNRDAGTIFLHADGERYVAKIIKRKAFGIAKRCNLSRGCFR